MQDTKNLKRKVKEYSAKIQASESLVDINYWRRELNNVYSRIRERDAKGAGNEKLYRKAN